MLSFIGIVAGLALFVVLAYRGFNLVFSAIISSCMMFLFSGIGIIEGLQEIYLTGFADFLKSYFMIFVLSALLGKLMSDGGNAKRIALGLSSIIQKSRKNQQFYCVLMVPVLYFILCYAGISGFVVIFTVLPIAKNLFEQTDTPWRLYCCAGAQSISSAFLIGSLQACNVYAADICGTSTIAGWKLSFISVIVFWGISLLMLKFVLKCTLVRGESFLPTGAAIREASLDEGLPVECLPGMWASVFPLLLMIVLSSVFRVDVVVALLLGCCFVIITGRKNLLPRLRNSLSDGIVSIYGPMLSVSATYAIGEVLKKLEGFQYFEAFFAGLPDIVGAPAMGIVVAFIMASSTAPIPAFGSQMLEQYMAAGISAENAHRMMMITSFASIAPHNAGISNAASVLRLPYSECLKLYIVFTYIPGFITTVVAVFCLATGIL